MGRRTTVATRTVVALSGAGALVGFLASAGDDSVDGGDSAAPPSILTVTCAPEGITVSGHALAAGPGGARVTVASTLPAGSYLTVSSPDGSGGGDPLPEKTEAWTFGVAPGTFTLACQPKGADPSDTDIAEITLTDPGRYWRAVTLDDLACSGRDEPYLGSRSGRTPQEAVEALLTTFEGPKHDYTARDAQMGYVEATSQTWLAYRNGLPYMSIDLQPDDAGYTAHPGFSC